MEDTGNIFEVFLKEAAIGIAACSAPGSYQTYLITPPITHGWKAGSKIAFALLISDIVLVPIVLLSRNQIPEGFLKFVRIRGAVLLLYLSNGIWQELKLNEKNGTNHTQKQNEGLLGGVLMIWMSPGP